MSTLSSCEHLLTMLYHQEPDRLPAHRFRCCLFFVLLMLLSAGHLPAAIILPPVFGDNMVLQRERPIVVWGQADPGEQVTVRFNRKQAQTVAGSDGHWQVNVPAMKAGGPYTMQITAPIPSPSLTC